MDVIAVEYLMAIASTEQGGVDSVSYLRCKIKGVLTLHREFDMRFRGRTKVSPFFVVGLFGFCGNCVDDRSVDYEQIGSV